MLSDVIYARGLAVIYASHLGLKDPGATAKVAAKHLLDDIPEEIFIAACNSIAIIKETPWSIIASIREEAKRLMCQDADSSYAIIENLMNRYYHPEIGKCMSEYIESKLVDMGRRDLVPLFYKWGGEIYSGSNPTATRAQFKKAFDTEIKLNSNGHRQLSNGNTPKLLGEIITNYNLEPKEK